MSESPNKPEDDLELAPETAEDLDADDADDVRGGINGPTQTCYMC